MKILIILLNLIHPDFKEDKVVIKKEFEIDDPKSMTVIIDNINGDVQVETSNDGKLYLTLEIEISAFNDALVDQAKNELKLGQLLADDSIMFYTKAPFIKKCQWKNGWGYSMEDQPNYAFKYQYKVRVPKDVSLEAKTVNNGDVMVANIDGPVKVYNVNGSIEARDVRILRGASTVNGDVKINFLESPKEPISFNTVNGDFNFELPADFNAQIYFDTMNGDLYTSFEYAELAPKVTKSQKNGKFKIGSKSGVEIGSGGPELSFKSINGSVYLKKS